MNIDRWIRKEFDRQAKIPTLEAALLGQKLSGYVIYRLRYFFLRLVAVVIIHAIEFPILYKSIHPGNISPVILFAASMHLIMQLWWGALESMRAEVRDSVLDHKSHQIERVINPWLRRSFSLALICLVLGLCFSFYLSTHFGLRLNSPEQAIMLIYLLRCTLSFPITAFHSGIYALRRVGSPILAIFILELAGLATALSLHPWLGAWAAPICIFITSLMQSFISATYIQKMYAFIGWNVSLWPPRGKALANIELIAPAALVPALACLAMSLDSLIIIGLTTSEYASRNTTLTIILFLASPLIRACHDWAMLFYPDIRRLGLDLFQHFYQLLNTAVSWTSIIVALLCWGIVVLTSTLIIGEQATSFLLPLLPFFVARSVLAISQVRAFTLQRFAQIIIGGIIFVVGGLIISQNSSDPSGQLVNFTLLYLPVIFITGTSFLNFLQWKRSRRLTLPSIWFQKLRDLLPTNIIGLIIFPSELECSANEKHQLCSQLSNLLSPAGAATFIGTRYLLFFDQQVAIKEKVIRKLALAGGNIENIRWFTSASECRKSIQELISKKSLGLNDKTDYAQSDRKGIFSALFPEGWSLNVKKSEKLPSGVSSSEVGGIMRAALFFAENWCSNVNEKKLHVSATVEGSAISEIFVVPLSNSKRSNKHLAWEIYLVNEALHQLLPENEPAVAKDHQ